MEDRLPLNALRAFAVAARHESFKIAADKLHVTAGAISRQIKQLETLLGAAVFDRHAHGVRLNPRGRRLAAAITPALEDMANALAAARCHEADKRLTVSAPPSFIQHWLLPRLADFEEAYDDVEIALDSSQRLTTPEWGADGTRLAIRYGRGPWPGARNIGLLGDTLFPVCSPQLLERGPALSQPADLVGHRLLHVAWRSPSGEPFPGWPEWLAAAGVAGIDGHIGQRYSLFGLALDQAIAGRGVALASSVIVADRLASGVLIAPFGTDSLLASPYAYDLITPLDGTPPPSVRAFIDWIMGQAEQFVLSAPGYVVPD